MVIWQIHGLRVRNLNNIK